MAAMTTALSALYTAGRTSVLAMDSHTSQAPRLVKVTRRFAEGNSPIQDMLIQVSYGGYESTEGELIATPVLTEIRCRAHVFTTGLESVLSAQAGVMADIGFSDEGQLTLQRGLPLV